jgi:hypothetical protein
MPVGLLIALLFVPTSALAHERRTIAGGKYDVTVGWDVEPAFEGQQNGAGIRITKAGTDPAQPVEGAEKTLKVQIRQGGQMREFALHTVFQKPGYYVADIVPTRSGDYQWTFVGQIENDQVNETFDTADGKFDGIKPIADLQFPVKVGGAAEAAQTAGAITEAQAAAQKAQMLAYIGIGVGIVGLLAALAAWIARPRATPSAPGRRPAAERA